MAAPTHAYCVSYFVSTVLARLGSFLPTLQKANAELEEVRLTMKAEHYQNRDRKLSVM